MYLSEVFDILKIKPEKSVQDTEILGITCSTDKVRKGFIFAAIKGENTDGHRFAREALEKGAAMVLGEEDLPLSGLYVRMENSELAYGRLCSEFWGNPQNELITVGVTGTNGKTTVTNLIRTICIAAGIGCGLIGTVENICGGESTPAAQTTPLQEELFPLLRKMADRGDKVCVMEVSSHGIARNKVKEIAFDVGVVTNVTEDHLDFHKTMDAYAKTKASLMKQCKTAVVNIDDSYAPLFMDKAEKTVTYGIEKKADFNSFDEGYSPEGISFNSPVGEITLPAGGKFSVYNALAAIAATDAMDIKHKYIKGGLSLFTGVKGRMELLKTKGKYKIYIDYAHTPDGLEKVLTALRQFAPKKIITVFGCGGDRDREKRPIMGEISGRLSDFSVVTSDNPRTENPTEIIEDILRGFKTYKFVAVNDRREAIRFAIRMAQEDDIILLAGKGHETYQIIGTEKIHMDEREMVREIEAEENIE